MHSTILCKKYTHVTVFFWGDPHGLCVNEDVYKRQGQTGRTFFERYKEHLPTSISNINKSNYAKHLVSLNHNYTNFEANCNPYTFAERDDIWMR